jgi:hypothetical protein
MTDKVAENIQWSKINSLHAPALSLKFTELLKNSDHSFAIIDVWKNRVKSLPHL